MKLSKEQNVFQLSVSRNPEFFFLLLNFMGAKIIRINGHDVKCLKIVENLI